MEDFPLNPQPPLEESCPRCSDRFDVGPCFRVGSFLVQPNSGGRIRSLASRSRGGTHSDSSLRLRIANRQVSVTVVSVPDTPWDTLIRPFETLIVIVHDSELKGLHELQEQGGAAKGNG